MSFSSSGAEVSICLSVCLWSKSYKCGYLSGLFDGISGSSCVPENSNVVGFVEIFESGGEFIRIALWLSAQGRLCK